MTVVGAGAADRDWLTGVWAKPSPPARPNTRSRNYAIETDRFRLDVELTDPRQGRPLVATVGKPVTFAVGATTVYVQEGSSERILHLLKRTPKLKVYSAAGPGHYLESVTGNGLTLTLEDGSVWEVSPQYVYRTKGWQPFAGITVTHDNSALPSIDVLPQAPNEYDYFLNNTDEDDGAGARLVSER